MPPSRACIYGTNNEPPQFAILGDSHAHALAFELGKALSEKSASLVEFSHTGCPPTYRYRREAKEGFYDCNSFHIEVMDRLRKMPNIATVFLWARWPLYVELDRFDNGEGGLEYGDRLSPLKDVFAGAADNEFRKQVGMLYEESITELIELGNNVVLIYAQPEMGWNIPIYISKSIQFDDLIERPVSISYRIFKNRTSFVHSVLDKPQSENLLRIHPEHYFCNSFVKNRCAAEDGTTPFYYDDDHVNSIGAALISKEIIKSLQQKGWLAKRS